MDLQLSQRIQLSLLSPLKLEKLKIILIPVNGSISQENETWRMTRVITVQESNDGRSKKAPEFLKLSEKDSQKESASTRQDLREDQQCASE